jgi:hypothetical protein
MNFLFSLAVGLGACLAIYLVWRYMVKQHEKINEVEVPPKVHMAVNALFGLIALFVIVSSLSTYGPRVELEQTATRTYQPQRAEVKSETVFIEEVDRFGNADKRIEQEPVEEP